MSRLTGGGAIRSLWCTTLQVKQQLLKIHVQDLCLSLQLASASRTSTTAMGGDIEREEAPAFCWLIGGAPLLVRHVTPPWLNPTSIPVNTCSAAPNGVELPSRRSRKSGNRMYHKSCHLFLSGISSSRASQHQQIHTHTHTACIAYFTLYLFLRN